MKILIVNGPNLNLVGTREPSVYGSTTFLDFYNELTAVYDDAAAFDYFQSNVEGELINALQEAVGTYDAILLNAGGYTHTSVALGDCVAAIDVPVFEVHISNPLAREDFRHTSYISGACAGTVSGFGLDSYRLALEGALAFCNSNS